MSKCYVIAEAGLNHNGSLSLAKSLIDSAVDAGCDCVKFQKRTVDTLAVGAVLDAEDARFPSLGKTYREIRQTLEFDEAAYRELKKYAEGKRIDFLCTAFDETAVNFLEELGVQAYKLASHSLTNQPLLRYVASKKKPVYLSTGMCTLEEMDSAVDIFKKSGTPLTLFHCVSIYPTPFEDCNLSMIGFLKKRYGIPIGFSGHEIGFLPTLVAVGLGAIAIERHITMDKKLEGFDHKISLEPQELKQMVSEIRQIEKMMGDGRKELREREKLTRGKYHVSMVSSQAIAPGTRLTESMVTYKNPGTGIPYKDAGKVLGKKAIRQIPTDTLLEQGMFE